MAFQITAGFKKYFLNTSWLMAERIFRMAVNLFIGVYIARFLGPEQFGLLSYALSFVGLFMVLANLGLDSVIVRELIRNPGKSQEFLGTGFFLQIAGVLMMWFIIAVFLALKKSGDDSDVLISIIAFAALFNAFNVIDYKFQADVKSKFVVYSQLLQLIISTITKLVLVILGSSVIWFAYVYVIDAIVLAVGLASVYRYNYGGIWGWKIKIELVVKLIRESWPLVLSGFVISIYMKIDQIMIKEFLDVEKVGIYAAAVKLSEAWYFIPMAITTSLFPAIVNAKKKDTKLYNTRVQNLFRLMVMLAIGIAIPTTFISDWLIKILYGNQFIEASVVLSIHIWAGIFVFLGVASGKWLLNEELQKIMFYRTFVGMLVNVGLNAIMIPKFGINGAAVATLISQFVAAFLFDIFHSKTRLCMLMKIRAFIFWKFHAQ